MLVTGRLKECAPALVDSVVGVAVLVVVCTCAMGRDSNNRYLAVGG